MICTAWGENGIADLLTEGTTCPMWQEGTELIHLIFAHTWEEAVTIYHDLQGWEPYKPMV